MDFSTGLIGGAITFIIGTCAFLARHILKSIFVDPSSNPRLFFENNQTKLTFRVSDTVSLENTLYENVNAEMEKYYSLYAPRALDPYKNPWFAVNDYSARMLNNCKQIFLESQEEFIGRSLYSDIIKQKWLPIDIYVVNKGSIATKSMLVKIKVSNITLFKSSKITVRHAKCYYPPTGKEQFNKDIIATADFYLKDFDYEYLEVTNEDPIQESVNLEIKDPIRQGKDNRIKLVTFYLDTSIASDIELEWNIYEDTLGKNGNHGILKIICIP